MRLWKERGHQVMLVYIRHDNREVTQEEVRAEWVVLGGAHQEVVLVGENEGDLESEYVLFSEKREWVCVG